MSWPPPLFHVVDHGVLVEVLAGEWIEPRAPQAFLHLCKFEQLSGVVERFFGGDLSVPVFEVPESAIDGGLVFEPGADLADEVFPHVYGRLAVGGLVGPSPAGQILSA